MAKRTAEYLAMIKTTSQLAHAVKGELTPLSLELVARQLISVDKGIELRNGNVGVVERAANLVAFVTNKVEQDRKNYYRFVEILIDNRSIYTEVLESLEPIYNTGGHFYNSGAPAGLTISQPWYHKRLSREDAEQRLGEMDTNAFLLRESMQIPGILVLSIKKRENHFYHFPIERGVGSYQVQGTDLPFSSVVELINYYKQNDLSDKDSGEMLLLKTPCICDAFQHSTLEKFNATAISISGNFYGPCIICLDQLAITVVRDQSECEQGKWPYNYIRKFYLNGPTNFRFESGSRHAFGIREHTFEFSDVETWNRFGCALQHFIGINRRLSQSQLHSYTCAQGNNYFSIECKAAPRPLTPVHHLPASEPSSDLLHSSGGFKCSPLRTSLSTGNLLESSSSSSSLQQVPYKTHICLFLPLSGGRPCVIEDERYRSTATQPSTSCEVPMPALPARECLAHPRPNSTGSIPTPSLDSISTPAGTNKPKLATNDTTELSAADLNDIEFHLPRSSPQVSRDVLSKYKANRRMQANQ